MDAELAAVARQLVRSDLGDPASARANGRARHAAEALPEEWNRLEVTDRVVPGGVPVRLYRPPGPGPLPAVVWLHGGSFILGDLDASDALCSRISAAAGALVVNVGYRLAPEHPCPAGLRDACAAMDWVASAARELNVDPARTALAGTSAGACLAVGTALLARDRGRSPPAYQLLTYPVLDDRCSTASARGFPDSPVITSESIELMWKTYLAGGVADEYVAPARAADLSGLPPTLIVVAEQDPLRDEAIDYATRLAQSGVDVVLHDVPGTFHGFDTLAPDAAISRRTREFYLSALAERLRAR
jgi:acetyl esterase/lipase